MSVNSTPPSQVLRLDQSGDVVFADMATCAVATAQVTSPSWGSGVVTLRRSNDALNWYALEYAITFSSDAISAGLDVHSFRYLGAVVTTVGSANATAQVTFYGFAE